MTRDESRAVTFLAVLLCLALLARYLNRPKPMIINAAPIDIEAFRAAGRSLAKPAEQPWTTPAWQRGTGAPSSHAGGRIDINRATQKELEALPGIGPAVAARIVARRDSIGRFEKVEDLDAVKGIGPALLQKIEPLIVIR